MYDGKDDPDNHLKHFNAIIRMERWTVPVACHMFALTLKDTARAWLDGLPMGSIMNFEDLKTKFRSFFSQQRKYKKIHLEAHNIKRKDNESIRQFIIRYTEETSLIKGLNEDQKISGFVHGLRYRPLVEFLSQDLPETYTSVMDKTYTFLIAKETAGEVHGAHALEGRPPWGGGPGSGGKRGRVYRNERVERHKHSPYPSHPRGLPSNRGMLFTPPRPQRDVLATERLPPRDRSKGKAKDLTKFCEFHNDHGHDTNDCRILKIKMEEAMKTGRLSNLIKGLKEQRLKNDQRRQNVVEHMGPKQEPLDEPIMMVEYARERHFTEGERQRWEQTAITFPMLPPDEGTEGPILIKAVIGNHPVNRVHLDTGSGCEIMYEHCFLNLRAALRMKRRDSGNALVGFSGEKSWPLGEINLRVVIGEHPRTRMEELTFIIIRAESPYNVILGRTAMRRMGIIPSPLHDLAMFPTRNGVGSVRSEYRKPHHYQSISIGKQLPTEVKKQLKDMLRLNKDAFAWAPSDMTGVPRQLKFGDEVFDTQHRLNVRPHVEPIKQKRRSLAPERARAA
uniref:uncharacterized protein LOC122601917 n=1 Tax=Erigeron canadensis TaxID=72917 RepID=UPI001CB8CD6F|nr:uncharacterized protein LOC122601917 [Erigeron canadensis]